MNFKELLRKHGYNLSSLGKKLGINRASPYWWVKRKTIPPRERLEKISEVLGESVETIVEAIEKS